MINYDMKIMENILSRKHDNNIRFSDLQKLLRQLKFNERIKGDHFIYKHDDIPDRINIQPIGNMAKAYQVRQIRNIIIKYDLDGE